MADDIGTLRELPADMAYLIEPAMKYGYYGANMRMGEMLANMTPEIRQELEALAARVRKAGDYKRVNEWLNTHWTSKHEHEQAAWLYFLFGFMDEADIKFE